MRMAAHATRNGRNRPETAGITHANEFARRAAATMRMAAHATRNAGRPAGRNVRFGMELAAQRH